MTEDEIKKIKETNKLPLFKRDKILIVIVAVSALLLNIFFVSNTPLYSVKNIELCILILVIMDILLIGPLIYALFQKKTIACYSKLSLDDKEWVIEKVCYETKYSIDDLFNEDNYRQIGFSLNDARTYYTARIVFDSEGYYINATRYTMNITSYHEATIRDVIEKLKEYESEIPT